MILCVKRDALDSRSLMRRTFCKDSGGDSFGDRRVDCLFLRARPLHPPGGIGLSCTWFKGRCVLRRFFSEKSRSGRGLESYLQWFYETAVLLHELLHEAGSIYVHLDYRVAHYAKLVLDEVFGADRFVAEILWKRRSGIVKQTKTFGACTDAILMFSKTQEYVYHRQFTTVGSADYVAERFKYTDEKGRRYRLSNLVNPGYRPTLRYEYKGYAPPSNGWAISLERMKQFDKEGKLEFPKTKDGRIQRRQYLDEWEGYPVQNLWTDIYQINPVAGELRGSPCAVAISAAASTSWSSVIFIV